MMVPLELCEDDSGVASRSIRDDPASKPFADAASSRVAMSIFLLVGFLSILSSYLGRHSNNDIAIWFSNGFQFAVVIRYRRKTWPLYALAGYVADTIGAFVTGETLPTAIAVSACNTLEIFLAAFLLYGWFGFPLKLSRPRPLFAFLGIGVLLAPAIACALASLWLTVANHAPWWTTYRTWFLGDAVGMAIFAPLVFTLQEPDFFAVFRRAKLLETLLVLTAPVVASLIVFNQSKEPLLFIVFPALIFVVFRRGFPGAVMAVFIVAAISFPLTVNGHGAMMLSAGPGLLHKIVLLQIFIAVMLFTVFPIAALLEESESLAVSLQQSESRYMELANTDALTGQANRRAFDQRLEAEWDRAVRLQRPLALLSIDIDLFKSYNDIYGHIAGDDCLRQVASLAAGALHLSTTARLYRLGGEEFAVILPEADPNASHALAERIRQAIFSARIEHSGSPLGRQTVSVGIVANIPQPGQHALSLLALSDKALYTAKHNGRNRCEAA